jgi:hypothetical protein
VSLLSLFLQTKFELVPANTEQLGKATVLLQKFPYRGLISAGVGLVFIVAAYLFFSRLKGEIESRTE